MGASAEDAYCVGGAFLCADYERGLGAVEGGGFGVGAARGGDCAAGVGGGFCLGVAGAVGELFQCSDLRGLPDGSGQRCGLGAKIVEASVAGWMGQAVAMGEAQSWRRQRRLARSGFAVGLDGFAWYEYGKRFKKLTGEQQAEIEQMRRANPRGKWMRERQAVLFNDERMRQDDYKMKASVQRVMSGVLIVSAIVWSWMRAQGYLIRPEIVVAWAWTVAVLSVTLRQAIVLWTEEDPRVVVGEMELVEREA